MSKREETDIDKEVQYIKRMCTSRVESLFVQHFHDAGNDDLPKLVESFDELFSNPEYDERVEERIHERVDELIYDLVTNFKFETNHKGEIQMSKVIKFSMRGE